MYYSNLKNPKSAHDSSIKICHLLPTIHCNIGRVVIDVFVFLVTNKYSILQFLYHNARTLSVDALKMPYANRQSNIDKITYSSVPSRGYNPAPSCHLLGCPSPDLNTIKQQ